MPPCSMPPLRPRTWRLPLVPALLALAACAGDGDELLAALDGHWTGAMTTDAGDLSLDATFEWRKEDELLFGLVSIALPGLPEPAVYAVRRWNTVGDEAFLDLTDEEDATHGMDLDGPVKEDSFSGDATTTEPCPEGTCGYSGKFTLEPAPGGTTIPTPATATY